MSLPPEKILPWNCMVSPVLVLQCKNGAGPALYLLSFICSPFLAATKLRSFNPPTRKLPARSPHVTNLFGRTDGARAAVTAARKREQGGGHADIQAGAGVRAGSFTATDVPPPADLRVLCRG